MLLAGGEGKRLGLLTKELAKPAVPFGGKYRIIDFALSNCANSSLQRVGVMTQYSPLELNKHIGNGGPWGMGGLIVVCTVLSPYTAQDGGDWYAGTADAIYQNIHYIDSYDPEYVIVISGDHIYQMDYTKLLSNIRKRVRMRRFLLNQYLGKKHLGLAFLIQKRTCKFMSSMKSLKNQRVI